MIEKILEEYKKAFKENIEASHAEVHAKIRKKAAYNNLLRVSQELRAKTQEALEDTMIIQ